MILGIEDLDPAVAKFAHELAASSIYPDIVGITELPGTGPCGAIGANELAGGGKDLDTVIAGIRDINLIAGIDFQAFRSIEFSGARAGFSKLKQRRVLFRGKYLNSIHGGVFRGEHIAAGIDRDRPSVCVSSGLPNARPTSCLTRARR